MKEVFISYISADEEKAKEVLNRLKGAGISCWFAPEDIPAGGNFAHEIPKAIAECTYFVLLLSNEALNSPYVMLELDQARKRRKTIIPIKLEQMDLNDEKHFLITTSQAVDATENFTLAVNKVIQRIKGDSFAPVLASHCEKQPRVQVWNNEIRCPYCGCVYVKRHSLENDDYFKPGKDGNKALRFLKLLTALSNEEGPGLIFLSLLYFAIAVMCGFAIHQLIQNEIVTVVFGFAVFLAEMCWYFESLGACNLLNRVKIAISVSGLRFQSLKCVGCEKKFSALVPAEGELKDWIPNLIETDEKKTDL